MTATTLLLNDFHGRTLAKLNIAAPNRQARQLISIQTQAEAREFGEEPVQLMEGIIYEYELSEGKQGYRLRESRLIKRSLLQAGVMDRGTVQPGNFTGRMPILLEDERGNVVASTAVEVRSSNLNYRSDFREMLDDIGRNSVDLLMQLRSPTERRLTVDPRHSPKTLQQRFFFLKSILESVEFGEAIGQITSQTHTRLEATTRRVSIKNASRLSRSTSRMFAKQGHRIAIPGSHPLYQQMRDQGIAGPTAPRNIDRSESNETLDTPENQFVKYALQSFSDCLEKIAGVLSKSTETDQRFVLRELNPLRNRLSELLERDFFRSVSDSRFINFGSPVLQRKGGYRELLSAWLKFNLAAQLSWQAADEIYGGGARNVADLYEYWVYFQLLTLIKKHFTLNVGYVNHLLRSSPDGFELRLKRGELLPVGGARTQSQERALRIQFNYNRTFTGGTSVQDPIHTASGSWTRQMRPDFTISVWPDGFSSAEAERQELIVHLHFDAKYRVESIDDLFGGDEEEDAQSDKRGQYKRQDLLKMHAYKDAIRRSGGAFILYPGTENRIFRAYREILPGLGAFVARPGQPGGIAGLEDFLVATMQHLSNRASDRERVSYYLSDTLTGPRGRPITKAIPEFDSSGTRREQPIADLTVAVLKCETTEQIEWINTNRRIVFGGAMDSFSLQKFASLIRADFVILCSPDNQLQAGIFRLGSIANIFLSSRPEAARDRDTYSSDGQYMQLSLTEDENYESYHWLTLPLVETIPLNGVALVPFITLFRGGADGESR